MNCYKLFLFIIFLSISINVLADFSYPNLREVKIGETFSHPNAAKNPNKSRPTTQFKVPNYGDESKVFPEYEVVILNSNKHVVVITAEVVTQSLEACKDELKKFRTLAELRFKSFIQVKNDNPNFFGVGNTYYNKESNEYYSLDCKSSYGPFWSLSYQIRGQIEDKELRAAWENNTN